MDTNHHLINCQGHLLDLSYPIVMGILNVTPDSFYDGGKFKEESAQIRQVEQMVKQGATVIDVGGMSSRPGAEIIGEGEEQSRVIPVIKMIKHHFPEVIVSIDTVYSGTAKAAVENGAGIINDISAGKIDPKMYQMVAELNVPYVLMHMQKRPETMQQNPEYENVMVDMIDFFIQEVGKLRNLNVKDIILDPGFGFGKTINHNYQILKQMADFSILNLPMLAGISRKSMIYKILETTPEEALNGTSALNMVALQQGARILRVHNVKPAMEVIRLFHQLQQIG